MSNALAIAAVTRSIVHLIGDGLARQSSEDPPAFPDAQSDVSSLTPSEMGRVFNKPRRVNVFLYNTAPNPRWRNDDLPGPARQGGAGRPLLALSLHYLITVLDKNGNTQDEAQILGRVMSLLHDHAILDPATITAAIGDPPLALLSLSQSDLARQPEPVRVTLEGLGADDVSRLWATFQEKYRTSVYYEATPVLIESTLAPRSALPVLSRGDADLGADVGADLASTPAIDAARAPRGLVGVRLGDQLTIEGTNLGGAVDWVVRRPPAAKNLAGFTAGFAGGKPTITAENNAGNVSELRAGLHTLIARVTRPQGAGRPDRLLASEPVPFALLPQIVTAARLKVVVVGGRLVLKIRVRPRVGKDQDVALAVGALTFRPQPFGDSSENLSFDLNDAIAELKSLDGPAPFARLKVDGVESPLIDLDGLGSTPPVRRFDPKLNVDLNP